MQARSKIAVAGATGRVGRHVVDVLKERGKDVVSISRSNGVDLITGNGLADALASVECVIDAASSPSPAQQDATDFFTAASRNLHSVGKRAGVERIVVVSIIGCDRFSAGYTAAKFAHERAMLSGSIPVQVLRAAQFYELIEQLVAWGKQDDVSFVTSMEIQPVAARTVAEALVDLAVRPIASMQSAKAEIPEIAGPHKENAVDLAKRFVTRRGDPLRVEGVSDLADPDHDLYGNGALLPGPHAMLRGPTFDEWLGSSVLP
jgi:uncharacterized protein YbjT (DUF2867 family)